MTNEQASRQDAGWGFQELLQLYTVYQDRQKLDLDMHLRFANWYTVTLTALATATILVIERSKVARTHPSSLYSPCSA